MHCMARTAPRQQRRSLRLAESTGKCSVGPRGSVRRSPVDHCSARPTVERKSPAGSPLRCCGTAPPPRRSTCHERRASARTRRAAATVRARARNVSIFDHRRDCGCMTVLRWVTAGQCMADDSARASAAVSGQFVCRLRVLSGRGAPISGCGTSACRRFLRRSRTIPPLVYRTVWRSRCRCA